MAEETVGNQQTQEETESTTSPQGKPEKKQTHIRYEKYQAQVRHARYLEQENEKLKKQMESTSSASKTEAPSEFKEPEPQIGDFAESDEPQIEWTRAHNKWAADKLKHELKQEQVASSRAQQEEERERQQRESDNAKWREGQKYFPDFETVAGTLSETASPTMAAIIMGIDDGEIRSKIAYQLGENPDEALRIAALAPRIQAAEIVALEKKLQAGQAAEGNGSNPHTEEPKTETHSTTLPAAKAPRTSQTPAPSTTRSPGASEKPTKSAANETTSEYIARREREMLEARRLGRSY